MSFQDTTLTPESGYLYVNYKQVYDAISARLTAHSAWTYVESVDYVSGANTTRTFVWKCESSASGLPEDFYVLFTLTFVTAGTVYQTTPGILLQVSVCELYNSSTKVASKLAPVMSGTSFVLAADRTHPATWTLTAVRPTNVAYSVIGPASSSTSHRMLIGVVSDGMMLASGNASPIMVYVGAIETMLSSVDDPMPVCLAANVIGNTSFSGSGAIFHYMSSTRHPLLAPGATTYAFGFAFAPYHSTVGSTFGAATFSRASSPADTAGGLVGDPTNTAYSLFQGGVLVSKCCVSSSGNQHSGSTRGGLRGFLKNMLGGAFAAHQFGDTFSIDGKTYVGFGSSAHGVWDTTA